MRFFVYIRDKFKGETLPVLDDAISLCTDLDMRMIINLVHLNYVAQCSMVRFILNLPFLCNIII